MMRIAMLLEYDGTSFVGWQAQEGLRAVQSEVELALSKVADHPIEVVCAGRTDAGVHAKGQVIHFDTEAVRSHYAWMMGANAYLPEDISSLGACSVSEDFHARYSAVARRYHYYIDNRPMRPAVMRQNVTWFRHPLNMVWMQQAAEQLLGEHDFSAFRGKDCQARSPMRCIQHIKFFKEGDFIVMAVEANAFLHHMVRNIVGVLLPIGTGKKPVSWAKEVLLSCDRKQAGITAPASGLYLQKVIYPKQFANLSEFRIDS